MIIYLLYCGKLKLCVCIDGEVHGWERGRDLGEHMPHMHPLGATGGNFVSQIFHHGCLVIKRYTTKQHPHKV